jgi:L-lactate dehydrogenase complex protein LldG
VSSKEEILGNIRKGLRNGQVPKPFPMADKEEGTYAFVSASKDVVEHFAENFINLGGKFAYCANEEELVQELVKLADKNSWAHVQISDKFIFNLLKDTNTNCFKMGETPDNLDAAITSCKKVVARLGSLILSSDSEYGRSLPVYTPIHIAVVYANQVVWDIEDALAEYQHAINLPSQITLTTGPSRTADIEKTLVVGVHGPKEVYVFYVDKLAPL